MVTGKTRLNIPALGNPVMREVITDGADCYPWQEVFAWWPVVTVSGQRVWLKRVYKRRVWICLFHLYGSSSHVTSQVQYATTFDLLSHTD
jgi:hypothetical protein